MPEDMTTRIEEAVREAAVENRISCTDARQVAAELDVEVSEVGASADRLGIKIYGCELGCF